MLVIADSSPLIALSIAGSLHLLDHLYDDVRVPRSVFNEVTVKDKPESKALYKIFENRVVDIPPDDIIMIDYTLGTGETEAMYLYKRLKADLLLIDDKRARKIADLNNINTIGTLGVLFEAKMRGIIPSIRPALVRLKNSDIHISADLCNYLLSKSGEESL